MNYPDLAALPDHAELVVEAWQLKRLYYMANMLGSGISPKGEMCFIWGKDLHEIVRLAVPLEA